jgi:hypothetical protein
MAPIHELLAGNSEAPSLDVYACAPGTYNVIPSAPIATVTPGPSTGSAFVYPVAHVSQNRVYVKHQSGEIWSYDVSAAWAPEFIAATNPLGNFLIDESSNFIYGISGFGDLVRVNIAPSVSHTVTVMVPNISPTTLPEPSFGYVPVLQWRRKPGSSSAHEICIQVASATGSIFPDTQAVLRFDPQTQSLLSPLIPPSPLGTTSINPSNAFDFGPDGDLYLAKAYVTGAPTPQVCRFDGVTGAFKNVVVGSGIAQNPTQVLFAPDGKTFLLTCGTLILAFDPAGVPVGAIPLPHTHPGWSTFYTPKAPKPPHTRQPRDASLVAILAGVVGDNSGFVRRQGHRWPEPWPGWTRETADRVWNDLDRSDKDAAVALAIHRLASLLHDQAAHPAIERALDAHLSEQARKRLAALLKR